MKWTPSQELAINASGNLLVAAAAGSGKTAVLTERIVRLIKEGADPLNFLVVTFTKAAAAEMKKRISNRLYAAASEEEDGSKARRLYVCAESIGRANISTMHSFCTQVLRRHFHEAGLDPAFRVADETQMSILKSDVLDELLEERYESNDPAFLRLVELCTSDDMLTEHVQKLHEFMSSQVEPERWLFEATEKYNITADELASSEAVRELVLSAKSRIAAALGEYCGVRDDIRDAYPKVAAFMDDESMRARALLLHDSYAGLASSLDAFAFNTLSGFPRGTPQEEKEGVKSVRDDVLKKTFRQLREQFSAPLQSEADRLFEYYPVMRALYQLVCDFQAKFAQAKAEGSMIDYADMEHLTIRLFENPKIAEEYRNRFTYIFVDEYQDSNRVQESILDCIKRKDNLFLVGDVKQSIYVFRLADPSLFMHKYDAYRPAFSSPGQGEEGPAGMRIDLSANFRSSAAVIGCVNGVFSAIMRRSTCGIDYDSNAALTHGREDDIPGGVELHIIDTGAGVPADGPGDSDPEEETENVEESAYALTDAEAEARVAAGRIRDLMANGRYYDPKTGEYRSYRYCDFVILHRAPAHVAEYWTQTLAQEGIPSMTNQSGGYFDAVEVQVFMNLLRVIDNRRQDIPLLSVLRSPIGGFDTEELIMLRAHRKEEDVLHSLTLAAEYDTALGAKCKAMLHKLERWQSESSLLELSDFIGMLLADTLFYDFASALPGGPSRRANLDALIARARNYEQNEICSLSSFIAFMDKAKKHDSMSAAQTGGADVVTVSSIHKSKGLEYPVVFIAGMSASFNLKDVRSPLLVDSELGLGIRFTQGGRRFDTFYRKAVAHRVRDKIIAENMRVLYVAMTRAKERLIMLGAVGNKDAKRFLKLYRRITPQSAMRARSFLDWVLPLGMEAKLHTAATFGEKLSALPQSEYENFTERAMALPSDGALFSWTYPYIAATQVPAKLSVSKLVGNMPALRKHPDFIEARLPMPAADKGTAAHALMERIPLIAHTPQTVHEALDALTRAGHMTKAQADAVDKEAIARFFASPLGKRLLSAKHVERELKFNHRVPASRLTGAQTPETILLQGMIDCCFMEDDGWVIIDYKTDYVPPHMTKEEAAARHAPQLALYRDALFALTGIPVKACYLHFLRLDDGTVKL